MPPPPGVPDVIIPSEDHPPHLLRWPALECNPHIFTNLLRSMGLPPSYTFHDVFGLEPEALDYVPRPVSAVVLSYEDEAVTHKPSSLPTSTSSEEQIEEEEPPTSPSLPSSKPFIHQLPSLENACGTIAALHAVAWAVPLEELAPGSILSGFLDSPGSPDSMGQRLDHHEDIRARHCFYASQGDTVQLSLEEEDKIKYHFVCFVRQGKDLVEIDGMKAGPIYHKGKATEEDLLVDCARFIKDDLLPRFLEGSTTSMSVVALSHGGGEEETAGL